MPSINPTLPNDGDPGWGDTLNAAINQIVSQGNAHDVQLGSVITSTQVDTKIATQAASDAATYAAQTVQESVRSEAFRTLLAPPQPQDRPTVTPVPWDNSILDANNRYRAADYNAPANMTTDPAFRYDCTPALNPAFGEFVTCDYLPDGASQGARYAYQFDTITQSANDHFWIILRPTSDTIEYRLWIDGRPLGLQASVMSGLTAGNPVFARFDFLVARARHIRFQTIGDVGFGGVVVPSGQTLVRPTNQINRRFALLGDSFVGGAYSVSRLNTGAYLAAMMLGAESIWQLGIGGTGYTTTSAGIYRNRIPAALAANPNVLIVSGTRNDGTADTPALRAAAAAVYSDIIAGGVPEAYITGPSTVDIAGNNTALRETAAAAGLPYLDELVEPWFDPATMTDPTDPGHIHPSFAGHQRIASRLHEDISAATAP